MGNGLGIDSDEDALSLIRNRNPTKLISDEDDDFGSSQRKQRTMAFIGRRNERNSDWEDASISGSVSVMILIDHHLFPMVIIEDFDANDRSGWEMNDAGGERRKSSPAPHGKNRGFQGNDRSRWKMDDAGGDRRKAAWGDDFERSSPGHHGNNGRRISKQWTVLGGEKMDNAGGDFTEF
ncbi:hypothetical protein NC653_030107 [Populus alba x Populus x berolinensis]|uniref:Uncharacterized protein n=1 Tax=Populus alba x Populus x berolinensis TaxID=444605 RepID=A0AAD6LVT4_9ROSI|nr:hypothetical protein NC653_030107 [Populus alba x Populus x berolinensis]